MYEGYKINKSYTYFKWIMVKVIPKVKAKLFEFPKPTTETLLSNVLKYASTVDC